ncbi:methyltransferase domain-containing protein [Colletotrichum sublineola]|uniref:Putative methyltransferase domain-containing protein n=1 Tax=Colletotrichum sublineola TaxID=1173701 RepID=A0A066XAH0_COLSU|nr:methyltransferase domain-containing protein [Colletotrichum sublineola]KDN65952.1 putative methyltransferase domain-containing protein [Colletotrichum sublineola]
MADHQQQVQQRQGQPSPVAPTTEPVTLPATESVAETEQVREESAPLDAHFSAGSFFPIVTSQASQHPSILDYRRENGRSYHRLSDGKYALPNDELEQERLDIVNHLWMLTFDGRLCLSPKIEGAKRVLDIGTGTGIWAMDYADEHPEAEVIGVDLSPIQPAYVPVNCIFEVDDLEKEWMWSEPFDFIFARNMVGSFSDWEGVIGQAFDNLEPGGYLELHDSIYPLICDDGTLTEESPLMKWTLLIAEACDRRGRSVRIGSQFPRLLEEAGFEDISVTNIKFPVSPWPKDPKLRLIGEWTQASLFPGIEGISLALFTRVLGWSVLETIVFCAQVRDQVKNTKYHGYWKGIAVYGRKPLVENGHDRNLSSTGMFSTPDDEYVVS